VSFLRVAARSGRGGGGGTRRRAGARAGAVIDVGSGRRTRLTESAGRLTANSVRDPAISPDGGTIAFDSGRFGWSEVLLMDARGRHQHRLTRELDWHACCPSWRP
jgi:Tol biopolymer transport system component